MKKVFSVLAKVISILYKVLPFVIGIYCYYPFFKSMDGRQFPLLDSIYESLKLYSGSTASGVEVSGLLELARFLALAATLSILISAFNRMTSVVNSLKIMSGDATAVYGNSLYADKLYESMNKNRRIRGENKLIKNASRYMLMFSSDVENIRFYNKNYDYLKNKNVYIMLNDVSRQNIENNRVTVFSIAENCARQYWRDNPVEKSERIAIVGFGNVGANILLYGLQVNIIDPSQHFEYHIFGNGELFCAQHTELDKMKPDEVIFHNNGIFDYSQTAMYDRVIICADEDESNVVALSKILECSTISCKIHVYAPKGDVITNLFGAGNITCFGNDDKLTSMDMILNERSMEAARKQHEFYYSKYGGTPWEKLDSFKRYSNVSSSEYLFTVERLIKNGVSAEILAELEHIRWCRYHYLNNWKYGEKTDSSKRIHHSLIPFSELSQEEKDKDIEAIKSKMDK